MIAFVLLRVLLILLLVAANAFFAAAEFSLISIRDTRIQQLIDDGRTGARIVQRLHQRLDEVVNGVQLGITMVSLTLGWIGEPMVARLVESLPYVHRVPHAAIYAHSIAIAIAFSLITYLHVLLGELVPKTLALQRAEQIALAVAAPMEAFLTLTRPVLFFMRRSGGLVLKLFGAREVRRAGGAVHSPDELKLIVTASRQFGQIPASQEEMIHNAIELDSITVREVMVARPDIFSLPSDLTLDDALNRVVESQHSRIPVYDPAARPRAHRRSVVLQGTRPLGAAPVSQSRPAPGLSASRARKSAKSCTTFWLSRKPKSWPNCWPNSKNAAVTSRW